MTEDKSCVFCGHPDHRHRIVDSIEEHVAAGDELTDVLHTFGLSLNDWLTVREEVRAAEAGADDIPELDGTWTLRVRILHLLDVKEGYTYLVDDGSQEVKAGTKMSIVEVYDANAVAFRAGRPARLEIIDLAGVRVLLEGVAL